jgi:hypothetical protein
MEQVPSTQRPDAGNEMDQTVNEGVGERTRFCAPFTREGQMTNEVRRRLTVRSTIYEQLKGCPIGGLMSAIYANIYCTHDERAFSKRWGLTEEAMWKVRMRPVLNEQTGPTTRQMTNEREWPRPKLKQFPMRTRKLISYRDLWNGGDRDRAGVERNEGEAKMQEK